MTWLPFNTVVLTASAITAILDPARIQAWAKYGSPKVLIVDWGIYALCLSSIIIAMGLGLDLYVVVPVALLACYLLSLAWNTIMYRRGDLDPTGRFLVVANVLNLLAIVELVHFLWKQDGGWGARLSWW